MHADRAQAMVYSSSRCPERPVFDWQLVLRQAGQTTFIQLIKEALSGAVVSARGVSHPQTVPTDVRKGPPWRRGSPAGGAAGGVRRRRVWPAAAAAAGGRRGRLRRSSAAGAEL